jgi:hypothetical protein
MTDKEKLFDFISVFVVKAAQTPGDLGANGPHA